jgi:hypothetical protein
MKLGAALKTSFIREIGSKCAHWDEHSTLC